MGLLSLGKRLVPGGLRYALQRNKTISGIVSRARAKHFAKTNKRFDICCAQLAHVLHLAGINLQGKTCTELGTGWVMSHAVGMHLLGAKKIICTDIEAIAFPENLKTAIRESVSYLPADILSPFEDRNQLRRRMEQLCAVETFDFETLKKVGIVYKAPIDLAVQPIGEATDFVFSASVFEHVPTEDIPKVLRNLMSDLRPGGQMIHCIHLEDHRDFNDPFRFLEDPAETYGRDMQTRWGNRVRKTEWTRIFSDLEAASFKYLYSYADLDRPLPAKIDAAVTHSDEEDLRCTHLAVLITKNG